jgi:cytochrome c553
MVDSLTTSPTGETSGDPMQRLAALKSSAPAAFKQVMNRVAEQLGQLANMAQGADADSLSQLAGSFANAAETGDISAYMPAQPPAAPVTPAPAPAPAAPPPVNPRDTALALVDAMTAPTATGLVSDPLQKLKDLKSADLPSFQKVMNQVAERLDQLSNFAEGEARDGLSKLAGIFASGSETGDLSALEPPVTAPPPAPPPAAAPSEHWRSGHALASYHRHGPPAAPQAIDDAFASALQLVDSLGS